MSKRSQDDFDNDRTDELPILLETVVLDEDGFATLADDTSEHAALDQAVHDHDHDRHAHRAASAPQTDALEAQIATLTHRHRDLERQLVEKDRLIGELKRNAALRQASQDPSSTQQRLAAQLAVRDARIEELTATVERAQQGTSEGANEVERLRGAAEMAQREAGALRKELEAVRAQSPPSADVGRLLEENATLASYIAGRRAWWDDLQAGHTALGARVVALEHELAAGAKRIAEAEELAQRETDRAVALRGELIDYARRATTLERELRGARSTSVSPSPEVGEVTPIPQPSPTATSSGASGSAPAPSEAPALLDGIATSAPAADAFAQLEAEVEYKRQQVAAQLVELRDREQRLQAATADLERLRRELSASRNDLDESRATVARLERAVIDKDRALEARDARITTLHDELKQRLGAIERLNAVDFSLPKIDTAAPARTAETGDDKAPGPALLCLTGDAPQRFGLAKKTTTVGRGPQCDLQILTHYVSREHARITTTGGAVLIEDLGSRNGVFVNGVRVDRQALQQGDLITIGETQFRFMESMAH
jgi:predicted RNase H-like nuclease (RuvC/YqgF family)